MSKKLKECSKEELLEIIKQLKSRKKFGLVWEDKPEKVVEQCKQELPVLEEVTNRAITRVDDIPTNLIIEGDNYHSLSVLNYTHAGKVDVIYIDPPYNTGSKDWQYNNDYVDSNDTYRHSKWLSFMDKRLKLAKNLLSERGVLVCTIDDNEHAALGVLFRELFPDKEIVCVTIVHNPGGIQGKNFSYCHEYAYFIYPKNGTYISTIKREEMAPTPMRDWGKESSKRIAAKNCFFPIFVKNEQVIGFGAVSDNSFHPTSANNQLSDGVVEVYPVDKSGIERKWRFSRQSIGSIRDELICQKNKGEYVIVRAKKDFRWKTVWTDTKYSANVYGTQLLNRIIVPKFPFPKSLYAVEDCIRAVIHNKEHAVILDFFAGSGTTGHAVLELNKEDGGKRQFILCTNNEDNNGSGTKIAEDICYPRVKNVIEGYAGIQGIPTNLRYFKTAFVKKSEVSDDTRYQLVQRSADMICVREDTYEHVEDKQDYKIFQNSNSYTAILYSLDALAALKQQLSKLEDKPVHIYVFSLTNDTHDADFADLKQEHKLCPIPESILEVYRKIFGSK